jgi:hypothetical protein
MVLVYPIRIGPGAIKPDAMERGSTSAINQRHKQAIKSQASSEPGSIKLGPSAVPRGLKETPRKGKGCTYLVGAYFMKQASCDSRWEMSKVRSKSRCHVHSRGRFGVLIQAGFATVLSAFATRFVAAI